MDCTSSFRDVPVRRIGGMKDGNVLVPISSKRILTPRFKLPVITKNHLDYMNSDQWRFALQEYLVPKHFVKMEKGEAVEVLKNLMNT